MNGQTAQITRLHRKLTSDIIRFYCQSGFIINNTFRKVYYYSTAATDDAAYIIGGNQETGYSPTIAEFKNDHWRKLGDLAQGRSGHGSISIGQQTMIVGGYTTG